MVFALGFAPLLLDDNLLHAPVTLFLLGHWVRIQRCSSLCSYLNPGDINVRLVLPCFSIHCQWLSAQKLRPDCNSDRSFLCPTTTIKHGFATVQVVNLGSARCCKGWSWPSCDKWQQMLLVLWMIRFSLGIELWSLRSLFRLFGNRHALRSWHVCFLPFSHLSNGLRVNPLNGQFTSFLVYPFEGKHGRC